VTLEAIFLISFVLLIVYIGKISSIYTSWEDAANWEPFYKDQEDFGASILIPMRNEAHHIYECIASVLLAADTSKLENLEIICIDDHSEDTSYQIVDGIKDKRVKVLSSKGIGKKAALHTGINASSYDYIMCTDGDCRVSPNWIRHTLSFLWKSKAKMTTGLVAISPTERYIEKWQYLDLLGMMAVTNHGIHTHQFRLANGANMAFKKSVFSDVGGYEANTTLASGDDVFLIQSAYQKYPDEVRFLKSSGSIVYTHGEDSWRKLWQQRKRWAGKTRAYQEKGVIHLQGYIWIYHLVTLSSLIAFPFWEGITFFTGLLLLFVKFCMDYLLLSRMATFFDNRKPLKWYLPIALMHFFYILLAGIQALLPQKYWWKNRKVT
jgi:biofilm PGA synthesis N-glycosyltransferase PgaC